MDMATTNLPSLINSISIGDIFWGQIKKDRISFRYKQLPPSVHMTLSYHPGNPLNNFHVSKNTSDEKNKPQIKVAYFGKDFEKVLAPSIGAFMLHHLFEPISFKSYSRRDRKNVRLLFFDELEKDPQSMIFKDQVMQLFLKHSVIKRQKLELDPSFFTAFEALAHTRDVLNLFNNHLRVLRNNTFHSTSFRPGILIRGNQSFVFIARNGRCHLLQKRKDLAEMLSFFMQPDLATALVQETAMAVDNIKDTLTFEDSRAFSNPYTLYIETGDPTAEAE